MKSTKASLIQKIFDELIKIMFEKNSFVFEFEFVMKMNESLLTYDDLT